jgi:hypothetical protein
VQVPASVDARSLDPRLIERDVQLRLMLEMADPSGEEIHVPGRD